jgi:predicted Zn-dependent protease
MFHEIHEFHMTSAMLSSPSLHTARLDASRSLFASGEPRTNVLTEEQATTLGGRLLERGSSLRIEHVARAVTRISNGRVLLHDEGAQLLLNLRPEYSNANEIGLVTTTTSQIGDAAVRAVLAQATAHTRGNLKPPESPRRPERYTYAPVSLWHASTIQAMADGRRDAVAQILTACRRAKVNGAATVGLIERSVAYMNHNGMTAYSRETNAEITLTVRLPDGTSSGWSGQAARDWNRFDVEALVQRAIDLAQCGKKPRALEPGRRTVILAPSAVAQLMPLFAKCFEAEPTDRGRTPFSKTNKGGNRLEQRVVDSRITMRSDPNDPDGGFSPFFELSDDLDSITDQGLPVPAMTWIENGVLKNLAYSVRYGLLKGKPYSFSPQSVRVEIGTSAKAATIDEMIVACDDGIYVNRLSGVEMVDAPSGMLTGVTRDGCFLVRHGKIERPVKNFRFTDSPVFFLNRVEMLGRSERVAFGYMPPTLSETGDGRTWPPSGRLAQWPRLPVIVPPMMVRDFNFSALSDAV